MQLNSVYINCCLHAAGKLGHQTQHAINAEGKDEGGNQSLKVVTSICDYGSCCVVVVFGGDGGGLIGDDIREMCC